MNPYDGPQQSWSNSQFLKLNIWNLTCFEKVVYLDADTMIVEPIDELFDRDCNFAAAPDVFPPDKFNA
ncbi:GYG2, partial [Symbiodinium microadriaticum]